MSQHKTRSRRLEWVFASLMSIGSGLVVVALATSTGACSQKQSVSKEAPAEDAEMKTAVINVFGMT